MTPEMIVPTPETVCPTDGTPLNCNGGLVATDGRCYGCPATRKPKPTEPHSTEEKTKVDKSFIWPRI